LTPQDPTHVPERTGSRFFTGPVNFKLNLPSQWKIHDVFHAKLLHPYKETEEYGVNFQEPPPDLIEGEEEWEVDQIRDERVQKGIKQYLIHWKGYSDAHDSWEPVTHINAPDLIATFQKEKQSSEGRHKGKRVKLG
jgi:hypothetical protein